MVKRKRIMRDFRIDEVSAVDCPAQGHAKMTIMKRADDDEPAGFDTLNEAVDAIIKAEGVPRLEAMSRVARAHPDLVEKYRDAGHEQVAKAAAHAKKAREESATAQAFCRHVDAIARRDGCSRFEAIQKARAEHPDDFDRYREAP